jgi:hypothetical protein
MVRILAATKRSLNRTPERCLFVAEQYTPRASIDATDSAASGSHGVGRSGIGARTLQAQSAPKKGAVTV